MARIWRKTGRIGRIFGAVLAFSVPGCVPAWSGNVLVNGQSCGGLSNLTVNTVGDVTLTSTSACGTSTPGAPPPVDVPTCAPNQKCVDRGGFPIMQEKFSLRAGQTLVLKVTSGASGSGIISTMYTSTGATSNRRVALSETPGDMNPANSRCASTGLEKTTIRYSIGVPQLYGCVIPSGKPAYINVTPTNCPDGAECEFHLSST